MGSVGDFAKGQQPMLDRIKAHNAAYNARVEAAALSAPLWRKLLLFCGWRTQFYSWLARHPAPTNDHQ